MNPEARRRQTEAARAARSVHAALRAAEAAAGRLREAGYVVVEPRGRRNAETVATAILALVPDCPGPSIDAIKRAVANRESELR